MASGGYSLVAMRGLLIAVASFLEHRLWSIWASVVAVHGLSSLGSWTLEHRTSSCGSQTWLLRGMRDLPRPGIEPVSPALTGEFFTIEPLGKPISALKDATILMLKLFSFPPRLGSHPYFH